MLFKFEPLTNQTGNIDGTEIILIILVSCMCISEIRLVIIKY